MEKDPGSPGPKRFLLRDLVALATSAAAATTTKVATPAAATATTGAFFTRPGNVHGQGATGEFFAVKSIDGFLGFFRGAHGDEAKPARPPCRAVHHQVSFKNRPVRRKGVLEVVLCKVETKVSYEQFCTHL